MQEDEPTAFVTYDKFEVYTVGGEILGGVEIKKETLGDVHGEVRNYKNRIRC
jgi:hypothetical protein